MPAPSAHRRQALILALGRLQTELRALELQKMGIKTRLVSLGKKGITYFKRRAEKYNLTGGHLLLLLLLRCCSQPLVMQSSACTAPTSKLLPAPWLPWQHNIAQACMRYALLRNRTAGVMLRSKHLGLPWRPAKRDL